MTPLKEIECIRVQNIKEIMSPNEIREKMVKKRVEKIPIINNDDEILGLVTFKDLERINERPSANLDSKGRLYVGAAVGANDVVRARRLQEAGVDVLVVDVANGHGKLCLDTVRELKKHVTVDIVAGSIATGDGAKRLIEAGADGVRCGIGNGSICITRIVAGAGVPQLTAIFDVAKICKEFNVPLISDGGNRFSGNMCKALAAGADCVMLGRLVGGCEESPSKVLYKDGKLVKIFRGMAGLGANISKSQRMGEKPADTKKYNAEGVEGYIPYAGPLKDVLHQFVSGIRSGISYCGGFSIAECQ